jgi:serine/threonine protein kinase/tetratricopeptide (TPR) repeat protein
MSTVRTCPHGHKWLLSEGEGLPAALPFVCPVCGEIDVQDPTRVTEVFAPAEEVISFLPLSGFEIRGELGRGGMGVVFRAFDAKRQKEVALKTMQRVEPTALYRFKQEFRALAGLTHPNLVSLYELISDGKDWFFTMELVEGVSFLNHVRSAAAGQAEPKEQPVSGLVAEAGTVRAATTIPPGLSPVQIRRLRESLPQLANGVHALHEAGKLHRDIKPGNVMVTKKGRVVLLDFGIAADLDRSGLHQSTEPHLLGTAAYMAPEQAEGRAVSAASDWYAVGVMLYEALTGRLPFEGTLLEILLKKQRDEPSSPASFLPNVPEDLNTLTVELMRRDPRERPSGMDILKRLGEPAGDSVPGAPLKVSPSSGWPLVGRKPHLAALSDAFQTSRQGRTVVLHLHGRSGVGKSALVRSFLEGLVEREEAVVLSGRCYEQEAVPYKALDSLVDALSRYLLRLTVPEVEVLLPRDVQPLSRVFPVLRRVGAVAQAPRRSLDNSDPQEERRRALSALRELLGRLGDRTPLVLFIDDLQWGDADSAALLADLLQPPESPSLLMLVGYRSEDASDNPCLRALLQRPNPAQAIDRRDLAVEPLTIEEGRELVLTLLDEAHPEAKSRAEAIARESGGNPFFLHELVRHVWQAGPIPEEQPSAPIGEVSLDAVLWDRVLRLPEEARSLLAVVAVAGRPLRQSEACAAAGSGSEGYSTLAHLRSVRLVRGAGPAEWNQVETYHDRIRETVVAHLAPPELQTHHGGLARALEEAGQADPERLAVHFQGANELAQAGKYFALAAVQAADALAFDRAAKLYRQALQLQAAHGPTDPSRRTAAIRWLQSGLGDALANAGRGAESAREYLAAAEGAAPAEGLELRRRAALQFLISGHIDEGLASLRTVLDEVGLKMPRTARSAFWSLALRRLQLRWRGLGFHARTSEEISPEVLHRLNICWAASVGLSMVDTIQGAFFQTRGLLLALDAGGPHQLARALAMEAAHASIGGSRSRQRTARLVQLAEELAKQENHPYSLGMVAMAKGIAAAFVGEWRQALALCDEAAEILRRSCTGVVWELDTAHRFALWALMFKGDVAEMTRRLPFLLKEANERDDLYAVMNLNLVVGTFVRLAADEPERARREPEPVLARWSRQGFHVQHMNRLYDEVQIDLYRGDHRAAWARVTTNWPTLRGSHFFRVQQVRIFLRDLRARSALAAAAGEANPRPYLSVADREARQLSREGVSWADGLAGLIRGAVLLARGVGEGATQIRAAAAQLELVEMPLHAAAARRLLGRFQGGTEGQALIAQADAWMREQKIQNPARLAALLAPGLHDS